MSKADRRELLVVSGIAAILLVPIALLLCAELKAPPMVAAAKTAPAKVAPAKVGKTKVKRKGKMVKIALGQTKQADAYAGDQTAGSVPGEWTVYNGVIGGLSVIESANGSGSTSASGWVFSSDGTTFVPVNPSFIGTKTIIFVTDTPAPEEPGMYLADIWELEVVCIDGEIRIAPVIS
jgi:hypothetical protein